MIPGDRRSVTLHETLETPGTPRSAPLHETPESDFVI